MPTASASSCNRPQRSSIPISWREPFGMVMLEALACGTPVVGCPQGAAPEIVEHGVTGFLGDSDAELINGLLSIDQIDRAVCREQVRRAVLGRANGRGIRARVRDATAASLRRRPPLRHRVDPGSRRIASPTRRAAHSTSGGRGTAAIPSANRSASEVFAMRSSAAHRAMPGSTPTRDRAS